MDARQSLIAELENAIQSGSEDKRVDTLGRITDFFVADSDRLSDKQIEAFDDVLGPLIEESKEAPTQGQSRCSMGSKKTQSSSTQFVRKGAMLVGVDGAAVGACAMLDVSATGTRLELSAPYTLPEQFVLVLSKDGRLRRP